MRRQATYAAGYVDDMLSHVTYDTEREIQHAIEWDASVWVSMRDVADEGTRVHDAGRC